MLVNAHTENDRLAVSFLMALGLHAAILLGVGFVLDYKPLTRPLEALDVVLVNWRSESEPEEVDFLAQEPNLSGEYDVMHSNRVFGFDAEGRCRVLMPNTANTQAMVEDLQQLLALR